MGKFGLVLVSVAGLAICGTGAMADSSQSTDTAQATTSTGDQDKIVCRSLGAQIGTRLGNRRECKTVREWDDIRRQNEKEISKMQARDSLGPTGH